MYHDITIGKQRYRVKVPDDPTKPWTVDAYVTRPKAPNTLIFKRVQRGPLKYTEVIKALKQQLQEV